MNAFDQPKKKHMPSTVEVDVIGVTSNNLPHGKVEVTLTIICNQSDNVPAQIEEGEKLNIELPSHKPPA